MTLKGFFILSNVVTVIWCGIIPAQALGKLSFLVAVTRTISIMLISNNGKILGRFFISTTFDGQGSAMAQRIDCYQCYVD